MNKHQTMYLLNRHKNLRDQVLNCLSENAFDGDDEAYDLINSYAQAMIETGTLDFDDANLYFVAFEHPDGSHSYSQLYCTREAADRRAVNAYNCSGHEIVSVYLYHAYCPHCYPDNAVPFNFDHHTHEECRAEPATHLDYLCVVKGKKNRSIIPENEE